MTDRLAPAKSTLRRTSVMICKWMRVCFLLLISVQVRAAQQPSNQEALTNEAIVELVKAKVGESVIVGMIHTLPARFSLNKDAIIKLKQQGVPDKVLAAMVAKGSSAAPALAPTPTAAESRPLSTAEEIASSASVGTWEIRDRKDPITDEEFFEAHLVAKDDRREEIEATATCYINTSGSELVGMFSNRKPPASQELRFDIAYASKTGQSLARTAMPVEVERAPEVFGTPVGNDTVSGGGSCVYTRVRVGDMVYSRVYSGGCGGKNVVSIIFSSWQPKASEIYGGILDNATGGDPGKQRIASSLSSLFPLMDTYVQAEIQSRGIFSGSVNDLLNANTFLMELPLNDGTTTLVPLQTQEPSFKKFAARCAANFAALAPPEPPAAKPRRSLAASMVPTTPWGKAILNPPKFAGTADEFAAAFPGLLQKAAQAAGFDAQAYEKESAFVMDSVRSCAQITPAMAAQATEYRQVITRNLGEQYAVCQSGGSAKANAKYPDTQIFFQVYSGGGENWRQGKGFTVFVLFFRAKEGTYPIVSATIPGPR